MDEKYCVKCGEKLVLKELETEGMVPFCNKCKEFRFPKYNVAVSMIVINKENNSILLIKQYGKDAFILVAGYVNKGERAEEAVLRELKEETGMRAVDLIFNQTSYFEPSNTLMCNFTVFVDDDKEMTPNKEIDFYKWFSFEEAAKNIMKGSLAQKFLNAYLDKTSLEK
ncbi:NAD+ diphosphatase [Acetitomaculum ruminis DSM 5522]|uniref:NAD(+) diphosphatase n=1 Tax=Acetitomaculum ruminis DSM 5522 TaxID=1120918 RepID=A0A1I0WND1_9FIRM|nr:NUDIX domain-containing protein [Acetitomaculum ruminis]SFA90259.1 NAD+ diphosphatase [Acetitomaculum ruminis DSM 5522]